MSDAYFNRGLIKEQKGDLNGAIADNTQALNLNPKDARAYCNRGLARLGQQDLDGALVDLRKFCDLVPRDSDTDYARLYIWLIATEQNPRGNADEELQSSLLNDWNSPPEDLVSKIAGFLLGHMSEDDLIANAASPDSSRDPGQHCKAWYFAGMKQLLAGKKAVAADYFRRSIGTGQKDYCEYIFAQSQLKLLKSAPDALPQ
jgi:lipoprotein NlpI